MLQLNKVSSGYGKKTVIKNVSLDIFENEILVLIGLNGSGKSTLLKTLLGLLHPTQGEILLNKKPLLKINLTERSKWISFLESESQVLFSTTVSELLDIATARAGHDFSKKALKAVGLEGYEKKNLLELSSGEVRRAFLAHALTLNSKYILLDEPFSHLDWSHQMELLTSLKNWKSEFKTTFVLAVHELERAIQLADRVGVMNKGQLIKLDTADHIFSSQEVCETFAFKASIDENPLDGSRRLTLGKGKSQLEDE